LEYSVFLAFSIGLLSVIHCLGMCSGIIGALTFSLPAEVHKDKRRLLPYVLSYNIGRILSYSLAGVVMGAVSSGFFNTISPSYGHAILQWIAALVLVIIGVHLAGWFPKLVSVEAIGQPVWRRIEPLGRRLLPVKSPWQAFLFGTIWGWLPCGLVYTTLIWAASSGNAGQSGLLMLAFGLGTLPIVMAAGVLTSWVSKLTLNPHFRKTAGIIIVLMALVSPFYALQPGAHDHHDINKWEGLPYDPDVHK